MAAETKSAAEPAEKLLSPQPAPGSRRKTKAVERPKAGFWLRLIATLLDGLIIFILQTLLGSILAVFGMATAIKAPQNLAVLVILFNYLLGIAYYIVFTGNCGQTPGKMALRIKVICCDGSQINYNRAALREVVGKFVAGIIFAIGYLMIAFDRQKQGLHDKISDTYVIKL
ncbi:RDD family protein [Malonomonas rubra]|uniref:RDD family protein n=1 Tax=Malonomonas rubra TaxID=57040 RepID=UPI0014288C15|nr:RDD family protein [Malonomonas rubra]